MESINQIFNIMTSVFGGWLLIPAGIGIGFLIIMHPFFGKDGYAYLMTFSIVGLLPAFLFLYMTTDLLKEHQALYYPPFIWIALVWVIIVAINWIKTE